MLKFDIFPAYKSPSKDILEQAVMITVLPTQHFIKITYDTHPTAQNVARQIEHAITALKMQMVQDVVNATFELKED